MATESESRKPGADTDESAGFEFSILPTVNSTKVLLYSGLSIVGVSAVVALFAPYIAPYGMNETNIMNAFAPPSQAHPLGTDVNGRDILTRIMFAYRNYMLIGFVGLLGSFSIGAGIGLVAGYFGGRVDDVLMRLTDALMAFPALILGLALVAAIGPSMGVLMLVIVVGFIPGFTRMGRNTAISIREEHYIRALQVRGVGHRRILIRHVLPNASTALGEQAMLRFGTMVIAIATLSFLGVGLQPPNPSLGLMISEGADNIQRGWWVAVFPSIALFALVLGPTLVGQALMEQFDPRTQQ